MANYLGVSSIYLISNNRDYDIVSLLCLLGYCSLSFYHMDCLSIKLQKISRSFLFFFFLQLKEIASSLSGRLLPPLLISLATCIAAHVLSWPVPSTLLCLLGPFVVCTTAPVPSTALSYAHIFRLNEALAAGLVHASTSLSLLLMVFLGATAVVSAKLESFLPFGTALAVVTMSIAMTTFLIRLKHASSVGAGGERPPKNKVKMVYTGSSPPAGIASSASAAALGKNVESSATGEAAGGTVALSEQQEESTSPSPPSEQGTQTPEKPRRSSFKDLGGGGASGEGEEKGERGPPPPAAAALRNIKRGSLLRTPLNGRGMGRVLGSRPRTVMSLLR
jgi:hypothetical protein